MMSTHTRAGRQSQPTARFADEQWRGEEERRRRRRAVGRDIGGAHDQAEEGEEVTELDEVEDVHHEEEEENVEAEGEGQQEI